MVVVIERQQLVADVALDSDVACFAHSSSISSMLAVLSRSDCESPFQQIVFASFAVAAEAEMILSMPSK